MSAASRCSRSSPSTWPTSLPWLHEFSNGGFLSVDVFFVLSGMLITEILVADFERYGAVSLKSFYRRRARRLLPALTVFLAVTVVYYQLVHHQGHRILKGLASVVSYVTVGHFIGPFPPGVSQAWTLVVEWEFYFIWPVVLVAAAAAQLLAAHDRLPDRGGNARRRAAARACCSSTTAATTSSATTSPRCGSRTCWPAVRSACWAPGRRRRTCCASVGLAFIVVATFQATYVAELDLLVWPAARSRRRPRSSCSRGSTPGGSTGCCPGRRSSGSAPCRTPFIYGASSRSASSIGTCCRGRPAVRAVLATVVSFGLAWASYRFVEERFRVRSRRAPATHLTVRPRRTPRPAGRSTTGGRRSAGR